MKIEMKNCKLLLLIFGVLLKGALTEMILEDICELEVAAMTELYTYVFQYVKTNQNTTQQISELKEQLANLVAKVEESHSILQTMQKQMEQMQQNPNGYIVIQRRMDGSVDFYRSWAEYRQGFGNSSGEFFIGLEKLHNLTNSRPYELLIDMEDWENHRRYVRYERFIIGSEAEKYILKSLGDYSGNAGDSLKYHLDKKFTTNDQSNIKYQNLKNPALTYKGAWWYRKLVTSNLFGQYLQPTSKDLYTGITWKGFKGGHYSLKYVEMIIRPT